MTPEITSWEIYEVSQDTITVLIDSNVNHLAFDQQRFEAECYENWEKSIRHEQKEAKLLKIA